MLQESKRDYEMRMAEMAYFHIVHECSDYIYARMINEHISFTQAMDDFERDVREALNV